MNYIEEQMSILERELEDCEKGCKDFAKSFLLTSLNGILEEAIKIAQELKEGHTRKDLFSAGYNQAMGSMTQVLDQMKFNFKKNE